MDLNDKKFTILLLTNRDSDNVGDQVIEASDIGLLHVLMKNLGIDKSAYQINSRAASIVTKKYMSTREPQLLCAAEKAISQADLVVLAELLYLIISIRIFMKELLLQLRLHKSITSR